VVFFISQDEHPTKGHIMPVLGSDALSPISFRRDVEFSSPSAAATVVHGGSANGLLAWRTQEGKTLKELESA
jgi:hypothetical protein